MLVKYACGRAVDLQARRLAVELSGGPSGFLMTAPFQVGLKQGLCRMHACMPMKPPVTASPALPWRKQLVCWGGERARQPTAARQLTATGRAGAAPPGVSQPCWSAAGCRGGRRDGCMHQPTGADCRWVAGGTAVCARLAGRRRALSMRRATGANQRCGPLHAWPFVFELDSPFNHAAMHGAHHLLCFTRTPAGQSWTGRCAAARSATGPR